MKRSTSIMAAALSLVLSTGAMAGCTSQQQEADVAVSQTDGSDVTESADLQEVTVDEFRSVMEAVPEAKSITIEEQNVSTTPEGGEDISVTTIYKFDESADPIRTSSEAEIFGMKHSYYTEGDNIVYVTGDTAYSGTAEQFEIDQAAGLQAYLNSIIGAPGVLADCASKVEKTEAAGLRFYVVTLDVDKYVASDEILKMLVDSGTTVKEAVASIGFEEDGSICSIDMKIVYDTNTHEWHLVMSDLNATTVDPLPEATATYEQLEADLRG